MDEDTLILRAMQMLQATVERLVKATQGLCDSLKALGRQGSMSSSLQALSTEEKGNHVVMTPGGLQKVGMDVVHTPGGPQKMAVVSESGLYRMTMRSNSTAARPFQDWVTKDVLPAIRKNGGYVAGQKKVATGEMDEDALILRAMQMLQPKVERLVKATQGLCDSLEALRRRPATYMPLDAQRPR